MMHDHTLHELHIGRGTWWQCSSGRRRQRPGWLAWRAGLDHDRGLILSYYDRLNQTKKERNNNRNDGSAL
jgi:hypothetical protein